MSDKLFVRDIIEQIAKLDPTLPTNIVRIETGSFQDMTRVHLKDDRMDDDEELGSEIIEKKRRVQELDRDVKALEYKLTEKREVYAKEALAHSTKMALLTERLRKIREQSRQRELPLP